jgi:hypothetical protein
MSEMEYLVGVALALIAGFCTTVAGLDRDRALYPAILIVVASYYDLFAAMGDSAALVSEISVTAAFLVLAIVGFRTTLWLVVVALAGHGVLDLFHGELVANAGVPTWWPMFCLSYDVAAAAYLAWRLVSKKIDASNALSFGRRIRAHVEVELVSAEAAERAGNPTAAFRHLERAHVLGQKSTVQHVPVHWRMLMWGLRQRKPNEVFGQITRVIGAAAKTWIGLIPNGNTGGADVSAFKPMPVADDLAELIDVARSPQHWLS